MTTIPRTLPGLEAPADRRWPSARSLLRGRLDEAAWIRPAHLSVTLLAAFLYLVNLTVSGFANTYYSAAALAASQSWSAWFFGSFDAANFITVDKPPLATMLMGLSVRLFGLNSWSILVPEALAGVATVAVLFAVVRRSFGPVAGFIAAVVMALTPAAVLIFRFNNPDALLTLLLVLAAGAFLKALDTGRLRWVLAAAILVGLAFNTKYLQAFLVLPAFAITYAIAAPGGLRRRLAGLMAAAAGVLLSSGWWVVIVQLLPADVRPFIGGSTTNSPLDLLFGYDGLARIFGGGGGPSGGVPGGAGGGGGFSGTPGILRLFNSEFGGQISWLIPFALIGLVTGLWMRRRASRMDRARAGYLLWGLWLLIHALVFSFMSGIIHSYYAVALAPAIATLVGAGAVEMWKLRTRFRFGGVLLGAAILASAAWSWALLERTPDFAPGLGPVVLFVGALVALILIVPLSPSRQRVQLLAAGLGLAVLLAGPATYALDTMATAYSSGDPQAGPVVAGGGGLGAGAPAGLGTGGLGGGSVPPGGVDGRATTGRLAGTPGGGNGAAPADGTGSGGSSSLVTYLLENRGSATWIVAATSAQEAGSIELASGAPVMAMGGFSGSDPAPTLAQFKAYVASGQLRFVLVGGGGGPGGSSTVTEIDVWAASVGVAVDYGGSGGTLYDLSAMSAGGA